MGTTRNLANALLTVAVGAAPTLLVWWAFKNCQGGVTQPALGQHICELVRDEHPLIAVNVLFAVFCCSVFWLLQHLLGSCWLIDVYWTIIPVMIGHFYTSHPDATGSQSRRLLAVILLWVWSLRLTHSYFRREQWQFGARHDWRFDDAAAQYGRHWWWISLFWIYASQQVMLIGVTLPAYAVSFPAAEPSVFPAPMDIAAAVLLVVGVLIAYSADTTLATFMADNERRRAEGMPPVLVLRRGLWAYSRRPNYLGEITIWSSYALLGVATGRWWTIAGTVFNTGVLIAVTSMTEQRMLSRPERRDVYERYQKTTSAILPWFNSWSDEDEQALARANKAAVTK